MHLHSRQNNCTPVLSWLLLYVVTHCCVEYCVHDVLGCFFHNIVFMYLMTTSLAKGLCYLFNVVTIHMLLNDAFTDDCSVVSVAVMLVSVCLCM